MEEEEDYHSARKAILSGNINDSVVQSLQLSLKRSIQSCSLLPSKSIELEFANTILQKCVLLAKSEVYKNLHQLITLSQIVTCCCRLMKFRHDSDGNSNHHRALYHFFYYLLDQSLHSEACELAEALWELIRPTDRERTSQIFSEEKNTVAQNVYILCWNAANKRQQQEHDLSLRLYSASLIHLCLTHQPSAVRQKLKQLASFFINAGVSVQKINAFVCDVWIALLKSSVHFEKCDLLLKAAFNVVYDWLKCQRQLKSAKNDCIIDPSLFVAAMPSALGRDFPLQDVIAIFWEIIQFFSNFGLQKSKKTTEVERKRTVVSRWIESLSNPAAKDLRPDLCSYIGFCLNAEAMKVIPQKAIYFMEPTPLQLQPLFIWMLDYCNSIAAASSGSAKSLTFTVYQSYCRLLLAEIQTEIFEVDDKSGMGSMEKKCSEHCLKVAHLLTDSLISCNVTKEEKILLAVDMTMLGSLLYKKRWYSLALPFLEPFCNLVSSYLNSSPFDESAFQMKEDIVFKRFELLIACYTSVGNLHKAFRAAAQGLAHFGLVVPNSFRHWLRIKKSAPSERKWLSQRTIKRELEMLDIVLPTDDIFHLLKLEFNSYQSCNSLEEDAYEVASDLLDVCDDPLEMGLINLDLTRLIIFSNVPSKMKAEDTCHLAVSFLEQEMENEKKALLAKSSLSVAYFWLYQIEWEKVQKVAMQTGMGQSGPPNDQQPPSYEHDEKNCDIVAAYPHVNLATQVQLHSSLDKAIELWEDLSKSSHVWSEEEVGLLKVVAEICLDAQKVQQYLRLQSVMVQVGHNQKNAELLLYGGGGMALFMVKQGLIKQAKVLLDAVEVAAKRHKGFDLLRIDYSFLHFQLVKAEICLYAAQVAEGLKCVTSVLSEIANEKKLKHLLLIEAEAKILRAKFCRISSVLLQSLPKKDRCDLLKQSPVMESLDALKLGTFLTKCIKDGSCTKQKVSEWFLYRHLFIRAGMESAIILGEMYLDIGAPREARCYLKESLNVAQELLLISQGVQILLHLAYLDLLCGNEKDCLVKVQGVVYMLDTSKSEHVVMFSPTNKREEDEHEATSTPWLCPEHLDDDDEEEVFVASPSSPSKFSWHTMPGVLLHPNNCSCDFCQCSGLELMRLKALWLRETCVCGGYKEMMASRVEDVLERLENFVEKCQSQLPVAYSLILKSANLLKAQNFSLPTAEKFETSHSNDLLTFECQVVISLACLLSRKLEFKKALNLITSAIQKIEKGSSCRHMLSALHARLLFEKVFLVLQYSSSLQGRKWAEMLVGRDPFQHQADLISRTPLHDWMSSCKEVVKTPAENDFSPCNANNTLKINQLLNAPQKKVTNSRSIRNFQEPCLDFMKTSCQYKTPLTESNLANSVVDVSSPSKVPNPKQPLQSLNGSPSRNRSSSLSDEIIVSKVKRAAKNVKLKQCDAEGLTLSKDQPKTSRRTRNRENIPPVAIEMSRNEDEGLLSPEISRAGDERCLRNQRNLRSKLDVTVVKSSQPKSIRMRKVQDIEVEASERDKLLETECARSKVEASVTKSSQVRRGRTKVHDSKVAASDFDKNVEGARSKVEERVTKSSQSRCSRTKVRDIQVEANNCDKHVETEGVREGVSFFQLSNSRTYEKQAALSSLQSLCTDETKELLEENPDGCLEDIENDLTSARLLISHHPPSRTFANISLFTALLLGFKKSDDGESRTIAAHHFAESVAVTLRHQGTICMQKRLRNGKSKNGAVYPGDDVKENALSFRTHHKNPTASIKMALDAIPSGWTVVQVCGINSTKRKSSSDGLATPDLVVCRYCKGSPPLFGFVTPRDQQTSFLKEFFKILEESSASLKNSHPETWWTLRRALDARMKSLCESMENVWLGWWKVLFLGSTVVGEKRIGAALKRLLQLGTKLGLTCRDQYLLQALLNASFSLSPEHLVRAVQYLWNTTGASNKEICNAIITETKWMNLAPTERQPVILILDKHVQKLPWECMPLLRNCVVTRIPSLHMLQAQLLSYNFRPEAVFRRGLDPRETFYVLNTRNDLPHTQRKFEEMFNRLDWHGVVGRYPTYEEMVSAITEYDLFLYCGHGNGSTFLAGENIEKLQSRSAVILMGCSSGHLRVLGEMEPMGIVQHYWLGGCPMVLANLWDVTDKDIDRFTENLLQSWLGEGGMSACEAVVKARQVCMLPHLIGCAPVVYGLPVFSAGKLDFKVLKNNEF